MRANCAPHISVVYKWRRLRAKVPCGYFEKSGPPRENGVTFRPAIVSTAVQGIALRDSRISSSGEAQISIRQHPKPPTAGDLRRLNESADSAYLSMGIPIMLPHSVHEPS